jgi:hypothetical protein
MVRLAVVVLGDRGLAEQVVQDAFVKLQVRWGGIRDLEAAPAYLRSAVLNDAWVSVGYITENGNESTAATIHLMRFGDRGDDTAPWEVVGTRDADTELLLERPDYGTTARSPMTVGGYVTGVDESLRVTVRQSSSAEPLGEACCIPAGGTESPWETEVTFSGASDPALTVIVSTGGHVQDVERFAITGLRS